MAVFSDRFPVELFEEIRKNPEQFRLLQQIPLLRGEMVKKLPLVLQQRHEGEQTYQCVFIYAYTTGSELKKSSKMIELALVKVTYSKERNLLLSLDEIVDSYEDPHEELSLEVRQESGLSDDKLSGERFNEERLSTLLSSKPLIIAHGAALLRPLFDLRFPLWNDLAWACFSRGINWEMFGVQGRELAYLNLIHGFFYQAKRASDHCLAMVWLMHLLPEAFMQLLEKARQNTYRINAVATPFAYKDRLKELGYRYEKIHEPCWYTTVFSREECDREIRKLTDLGLGAYLKVFEITARTRFK